MKKIFLIPAIITVAFGITLPALSEIYFDQDGTPTPSGNPWHTYQNEFGLSRHFQEKNSDFLNWEIEKRIKQILFSVASSPPYYYDISITKYLQCYPLQHSQLSKYIFLLSLYKERFSTTYEPSNLQSLRSLTNDELHDILLTMGKSGKKQLAKLVESEQEYYFLKAANGEQEAIPYLIKTIDENTRKDRLDNYSEYSDETVPKLMLQDECKALELLCEFGIAANKALPILKKSLNSPNSKKALLAAKVILSIDPSDRDAKERLSKNVKGDIYCGVLHICQTPLVTNKKQADSILDQIYKTLKDSRKNPTRRNDALQARSIILKRFYPTPTNKIFELYLKYHDNVDKKYLIINSEQSLPLVLALSQSSSPSDRFTSKILLSKMGVDTTHQLYPEYKDWQQRNKPQKTYSSIEQKYKNIRTSQLKPEERKNLIQGMIKELRTVKQYHHSKAYREIERQGPLMLPQLTLLLDGQDPLAMDAACQIIGDMGPYAAIAVTPLIKALSHNNWLVRAYAARALGKIGPEARSSIPVLITLLTKELKKPVKQAVAEALIMLSDSNPIIHTSNDSSITTSSATSACTSSPNQLQVEHIEIILDTEYYLLGTEANTSKVMQKDLHAWLKDALTQLITSDRETE